MAKGVLGIIACPMLEDELVRSVADDPEEKRIVVIATPHRGSIVRKLSAAGIAFEEMDERDFMNGWGDIDREKFTVAVFMNSLGLHAEPKELVAFIQDQLTMLKGRVDAAGLYYGMCGNYGWDITAWSKKNLPFRVAVFRDCSGRVCDDCVAVAVGGLDGYRRVLREYTGMLLLTPAVATNWLDFLMAGEMGKSIRYVKPSGNPEQDMKDLLILCGYDSAVQIDTGLGDGKEFDAAAKNIADFLEFRLLRAPEGTADRGPMVRLWAECKSYLRER